MIKSKAKTSNKGAALLISVIISTVVLAVGFGVYQRTYKELLFSSMWKQTQVAFAAADAGLECALYRDLHAATSCFGNPFPWTPLANGTWSLSGLPVGAGCVNLTVTKNSTAGTTVIDARGYNDSCTSVSPRRVERGLRVNY